MNRHTFQNWTLQTSLQWSTSAIVMTSAHACFQQAAFVMAFFPPNVSSVAAYMFVNNIVTVLFIIYTYIWCPALKVKWKASWHNWGMGWEFYEPLGTTSAKFYSLSRAQGSLLKYLMLRGHFVKQQEWTGVLCVCMCGQSGAECWFLQNFWSPHWGWGQARSRCVLLTCYFSNLEVIQVIGCAIERYYLVKLLT